MTNDEVIAWLEARPGVALVHDDEEAWAVGGDGTQNIRSLGDGTLESVFWVEDLDSFKPTIREAVEYAAQLEIEEAEEAEREEP